MSFSCRECHAEFDKPYEYKRKEWIEYWGAITLETFFEWGCPECASEDFEEILEHADE